MGLDGATHSRTSRPLPGIQPAGLPGLAKSASPMGPKGMGQGTAMRVGLSPRGVPTYTQPAPGVNVLDDIFSSVSPKSPQESSGDALKKRVCEARGIERR